MAVDNGRRKLRTDLVKGVNLDSSLRDTGESPLGTLAGGPETPKGARIIRDIKLGLPLELVLEVFEECIVEIFTTKVGITGSCLYSENTTVDIEERNIKGSSSEIEDKHIFLFFGLTVETVSNSGSSRLIDDTEDIETRDGTSILGCKTL